MTPLHARTRPFSPLSTFISQHHLHQNHRLKKNEIANLNPTSLLPTTDGVVPNHSLHNNLSFLHSKSFHFPERCQIKLNQRSVQRFYFATKIDTITQTQYANVDTVNPESVPLSNSSTSSQIMSEEEKIRRLFRENQLLRGKLKR